MKISKQFIFTTASIVGVAATGVVSYIVGGKNKGSKPSKENWKSYIFPAVVGGATVATIVVNHRVNAKELAAAGATIGYLVANRDALEKKIEEKFGHETLQEIKKEIREETTREKPSRNLYNGPSIEDTGKGDLLCFEGYSGRWFWSSKEAVEEAEDELNSTFRTDIYCCLNDFYKYLGIEETHFGFEYGWVNHEDWYTESDGIRFENTIAFDRDKGCDVLYIDIFTYPMQCWQEI